MTLSPEQLIGFVNMVFWPFVRIGALLMASPLFGARTFPVRQRILLALLVSLLIAPLLPPIPMIHALSAEGFLITAQQIAVGVAMGFILQMVFAAMVVAGQTIATSMGLGFAATIDPQNGVQVPVVSQYFLILACSRPIVSCTAALMRSSSIPVRLKLVFSFSPIHSPLAL